MDQIREVVYETDEKYINQKLSEGWVILQTASGKDSDGYPHILVLLGLPAKD